MPKLWEETVNAHRREVRDAILHTTAALVAERGLRAVTMSQIAERTGIGRATLYRYFADVEAVLLAWHEDQITAHLVQLEEIRDAAHPRDRLRAVLEAYALLSRRSHGHYDADLEGFLHGDGQVARARHQVRDLVSDVLAEGAQRGMVRDDIPPDELAGYCVHALAAAGNLPTDAAVRRLVTVTLAGLHRCGDHPTTSDLRPAQGG
ncbi:MAG: TetR/AcrR family transcriptional regulator [Acidimicrobiia bacterium]